MTLLLLVTQQTKIVKDLLNQAEKVYFLLNKKCLPDTQTGSILPLIRQNYNQLPINRKG